MKPVAAALFLLILTGCTSTSSSSPDLDLNQKIEVKCVSSNVRPNGCTTSHEIELAARFDTNTGTLPGPADLRAPGAGGSEF